MNGLTKRLLTGKRQSLHNFKNLTGKKRKKQNNSQTVVVLVLLRMRRIFFYTSVGWKCFSHQCVYTTVCMYWLPDSRGCLLLAVFLIWRGELTEVTHNTLLSKLCPWNDLQLVQSYRCWLVVRVLSKVLQTTWSISDFHQIIFF